VDGAVMVEVDERKTEEMGDWSQLVLREVAVAIDVKIGEGEIGGDLDPPRVRAAGDIALPPLALHIRTHHGSSRTRASHPLEDGRAAGRPPERPSGRAEPRTPRISEMTVIFA